MGTRGEGETAMPDQARPRAEARTAPDLGIILSATGALIAIVAIGSGIAALLPDPDVWQLASAFLAPASLAFVAWWWATQKV